MGRRKKERPRREGVPLDEKKAFCYHRREIARRTVFYSNSRYEKEVGKICFLRAVPGSVCQFYPRWPSSCTVTGVTDQALEATKKTKYFPSLSSHETEYESFHAHTHTHTPFHPAETTQEVRRQERGHACAQGDPRRPTFAVRCRRDITTTTTTMPPVVP